MTGVVNDANPRITSRGVLGGIHAGYLWQQGAFGGGVEGDLEASGIRGTWSWNNGNFLHRNTNWLGSARLRGGIVADRIFLYATAGLAFGGVSASAVQGAIATISASQTKVGWTAGVGAEMALAPQWRARLEYRYTDLGRSGVNGAIYGGNFTYNGSNQIHAVRLGVSYVFSTGGAVVARY